MPPPDDSWDLPPDGLIRALMEEHAITREQAIRRIGLDSEVVQDNADDLGLVAFRTLDDGARFRLHGTLYRKKLPRIPIGSRLLVDPEYDYDVRRSRQRPNARSVEPVSGRKYRLAYVRPDHAVEPVTGRA